MAHLQQVSVNGETLSLRNGLEGRIASTIDRTGTGSCVVVQVGIQQKSYSFTFPSGCAGRGGGGGLNSQPAELRRLNQIYRDALEDLQRNPATIRKTIIQFIKSL